MFEAEKEKKFFEMDNVIQNFAWGSKSSFNQLFDIDNIGDEPQAEMWMGAHPNGCSKVQSSDLKVLLSQLIDVHKDEFLSKQISEKFGELPYLFKILAAESALSVQVHPSKEEAELGFHKEEQAQVPLSAHHRNYRDSNHKPELVYALTSYQAMNGFRAIPEIISLFSGVGVPQLSELLEHFNANPSSEGLREFFVGILSLEGDNKVEAVDSLVSQVEDNVTQELSSLILTLSDQYPGDVGLFTPLMLNVITLEPGEAMYLDARTPHAYLKGTALEVMANSDNVLRAGLTPKHIDVQELASCTLFEEKPFDALKLAPIIENGVLTYPVPVPDFRFSVYENPNNELVCPESAEILLPLDAELTLTHDSGEVVTLKKGKSVFIPAYVDEYRISSKGNVAKAHC
ncbi:mannose-6-phosphate isomerase, class I [Vibrio sp. 10N.222.54.F12]|uniref:mannose-6-phosphate isomerase, class I n=1 Tax=Vibrio TaxID=662 RepID=UPI000C81E329|nr:mannose-6-phosphate isomerase, class I [Vibrio tasmaniensis]PML18561.1 mannose-6-phosphate isomerase, class I [Vibrio tasmaniensis]PML49390.1 mannose-6-phosphate isomerase, class I [Vibrio tasmaniensis]